MSQDVRPRWRFWLADQALALGGLALVALGMAGLPLPLSLGWAALGVSFLAWAAEHGKIPLLRPCRVAIRPSGGLVPFAFTVRRGRLDG